MILSHHSSSWTHGDSYKYYNNYQSYFLGLGGLLPNFHRLFYSHIPEYDSPYYSPNYSPRVCIVAMVQQQRRNTMSILVDSADTGSTLHSRILVSQYHSKCVKCSKYGHQLEPRGSSMTWVWNLDLLFLPSTYYSQNYSGIICLGLLLPSL